MWRSQDGAGFHLREGHALRPSNVRLLTLPPSSPGLNPIEKRWDQIKDVPCNRAFTTLEKLQETMGEWLKTFWANARRPFGLIGRGWLLDQANSSSVNVIPM